MIAGLARVVQMEFAMITPTDSMCHDLTNRFQCELLFPAIKVNDCVSSQTLSRNSLEASMIAGLARVVQMEFAMITLTDSMCHDLTNRFHVP